MNFFLIFNKIKTKLIFIFQGMAIGIANIIPGVSGGTIAVILGIYDQLISAINNLFSKNFNKIKQSFLYLFWIGSGVILGIGAFSFLITYLLDNFQNQTMFFFMGLIAGSIPFILKLSGAKRLNINNLIALSIGLFLIIILPNTHITTNSSSISTITPSLAFFLILSGFLASGTMVIPGISGSMILVLLGSYNIILKSVTELNFFIIFLVLIGAGLGIIAFAKLINFCLSRFHTLTYYFILGLIISSLIKLYPQNPNNFIQLISYLICFLIGLSISYLGELKNKIK